MLIQKIMANKDGHLSLRWSNKYSPTQISNSYNRGHTSFFLWCDFNCIQLANQVKSILWAHCVTRSGRSFWTNNIAQASAYSELPFFPPKLSYVPFVLARDHLGKLEMEK
jgi:hypothetical protein